MSDYQLRLFVNGPKARNAEAIARMEAICREDLAGRYRLEVIDVLDNPDAADAASIIATPTLIKQLPPPLRQLIGDLSDRDKVLKGLDLVRVQKPENGTG